MKSYPPEFRRAAKIAISSLIASFQKQEAEAIAKALISWATGIPHKQWILYPDRPITAKQGDLITNACARILNGEPLQYITGEAWFFGRKFAVGPGVLIPRPETEELTELAIREIRIRALNQPVILDVCSGSGCIAITLDKEISTSKVNALEISPKALDYALKNATELNSTVNFHQADIFKATNSDFSDLDLIVSNPPYVLDSDKELMQANVLEHEPPLALFPENAENLPFYRKIADLGRFWLKDGGSILFEIHENFGFSMQELLQSMDYTEVTIKNDLSGRDRFVLASKRKG